ncbi:MAG: hypothetical protein HN742_43075 [Lentisphaerae bacterium]|jgi:hypothetical protein|nr:hypothetical protein [Lentisphaerota bacterium]MBT5604303.1 hypothetical protein [Lentisphaerota bacterium]MBT7054461.1 hypothetical protein [Lentisphaerota bacterium]MBT7848721.1 hypothetical protein [Lentisphaerota bacterium]
MTPPVATSITSTMSGCPTRIPLSARPDGTLSFSFTAPPGLFQFSSIIDAQDFDWESLYTDLYDYGNSGQRTGPWDFKLGPSNALVPSYWVTVDDQPIGLWYFQRISLEDLAAKRFRGRFACRLKNDGNHTVELVPYNYPEAAWLSAQLEPDPVDRLQTVPPALRSALGNVPTPWSAPGSWREQKQHLATVPFSMRDSLTAALRWALTRGPGQDIRAANRLDIPLLAAAWGLLDDADARDRAIALVTETVELEHWGNPRADGYGHNGDMGAALIIRAMAWARHMLHNELGTDLRERLTEKLRLQGNSFVSRALLNRDYWGGSILQDHGWRSLWTFGTAALNLYGIIPEAEEWLEFVLPRARRCVDAMPRDGSIPPSSHRSTYLYLEELSLFRWTLLALGGDDIYDWGPFEPIAPFVWNVLRKQDHQQLADMDTGLFQLIGGPTFFSHMFTRTGDPHAARLLRLLLDKGEQPHHRKNLGASHHHSRFWPFFAGAPPPAPLPDVPDVPPRRLMYLADSALVHFRDDNLDTTLSLSCGPWCGYHAEHHAPDPCDRMMMKVAAGDFRLALAGQTMLNPADSGYALHSSTGSVMLIDDAGQRCDVGYPMSLPSQPHRGEEIRRVQWHEDSGTGLIRLELTPVYPDEADLIRYWRDILIQPGRELVIRDHVLLERPRKLSWLFQADEQRGLSLDGLIGRLAGPPELAIQPIVDNVELTASIKRTHQVYSYSSARAIFRHFRYDTAQPVTDICIDFTLTWEP